MKALLLSEYGHLEMSDVAEPEPEVGELLIAVAACGICGSDVHGFDGSSGRRIPPLVMGHEAAGVVAGVGAGVTRFQVGDRVTFDSTVYCGACVYCQRGEINLCDRREVVGVSCREFRRAGAFAEYVTVPERIVYGLPEGLEFAEAAMLEAVAVALHAVHLAEIGPGETAVVIGAGMIGLLTMQAALALGCRRVLVADVDGTRLAMAEELGATEALLASGGELAQRVKALTDGHGAAVVFEAVGRDETVTAAVDAVRKGGTVVLVGNITPEVTLPLQKVVSRQIRLQGSCASCGEYPEAIELVSNGRIRVKPLITAVAPLEDGARWFARLHAREPNLMKVVLDPRLKVSMGSGMDSGEGEAGR
uniref:Alcohol dehydrogenase GroES domain protein n=1 Tax=mine drainage metagenome TaxID=410659 RepID=E6PYL5_9ZZZZ